MHRIDKWDLWAGMYKEVGKLFAGHGIILMAWHHHNEYILFINSWMD